MEENNPGDEVISWIMFKFTFSSEDAEKFIVEVTIFMLKFSL